MTGEDTARDAAEIRGMDELFRRADFAADVPNLEARLWQKIQAKLAERELAEDELEELAAASGEPVFFGKIPKQ